jgi:hypothetical protein
MNQKLNLLWLSFLILTALKPNLIHAQKKSDLPKQQQFRHLLQQPTGFLENEGQVVDETGEVQTDVRYIFDHKGFKLILKKSSFSYEIYKTVSSNKLISEATGKPQNNQFNNISKPAPVTYYTSRVDVEMVGGNANPEIIKEGESKDFVNYYRDINDRKKVTGIHYFQTVTYKNIYSNIDFVFTTQPDGSIKYNIVVRPGGRLSDINMCYKGMGMLKENGNQILISTPQGTINEIIPRSYILKDNSPVAVKYATHLNNVTFKAKYDHKQTLIIDPIVRSWSSYFGGSDDEKGNSVTVDATGNVYMAGETSSSSSVATSGAYQTTYSGNNDAFLIKFDKNGVLKWATYFGGADDDKGNSLAVDTTGNIYLAGETSSSTGIATSGAYQTSIGGNSDAFLAKFSSNGTLLWNTYFGGSAIEIGYSVATDASENVFLTGFTYSNSGIASSGTYQTTNGGNNDAFLVKFNSSGTKQWATYFGGNYYDIGYALATDISGNVYLNGYTSSSSGVATSGAYQTSNGGSYDAFLAKFNSSGSLQWATYYGGSSDEYGYSVSTDATGNVFIAGNTQSLSGIASSGAYQTSLSGSSDGYLAKFSSDGTFQWATYFGGSNSDNAFGTTTDPSGNVYLAGYTGSTSGITTSGAFQTLNAGGSDAYLAKFNNEGSIQWSTYYGGTNNEICGDIALDAFGNIYLAGSTSSSGISTTGAYQTTKAGGSDAFLVKFDQGYKFAATFYGGESADIGYSVASDGSGNVYLAGFTSSSTGIATSGAYQDYYNGNTDAFLAKFNSSGALLWATYFGGGDGDNGFNLALDISGNIYLAGNTTSLSGIATSSAYQSSNSGSTDAFLAKFNGSGALQWATYFGGSSDENGNSVVTDASGNVYLAGTTKSSSGIATSGAYRTTIGGDYDAYIAKFNSSGVLQWSTYFGGINYDGGNSLAVDASGNIFLTGDTYSSSAIASSGAYQTTNGGGSDAYLAKFNSSGAFKWATYFGGTGTENGNAVKTDASGNIIMIGNTNSSTKIATSGAFQTTLGGKNDVFVAKFNTSGALQWSTYFGGSEADNGYSVTTDASNNIYLAGYTKSTSGIATSGAYQTTNAGGNDVFISKFNSGGTLQMASYIGGSGDDFAFSVFSDVSGNVFLAGHTRSSSGFSSPYAYQIVNAGENDAFLVKFDALLTPLPVEFISFKAEKIGKSAVLTWVTASELNNAGFTIERSQDALHWTSIGFVASLSSDGNSQQKLHYRYVDNDLSNCKGNIYYRLKQIDFNGTTSYSKVRSIRNDVSENQLVVIPNPARDHIEIDFGTNLPQAKILVFTSQGNLVLQSFVEQANAVNLNIEQLPSGIYILKILSLDQTMEKVFIKL